MLKHRARGFREYRQRKLSQTLGIGEFSSPRKSRGFCGERNLSFRLFARDQCPPGVRRLHLATPTEFSLPVGKRFLAAVAGSLRVASSRRTARLLAELPLPRGSTRFWKAILIFLLLSSMIFRELIFIINIISYLVKLIKIPLQPKA